MSSAKMGKTLPRKTARDLEQKIATMVMSALRKDFPKLKFADRAIRHEIDVNFGAVKKWYNGQNAPNSWHFLKLVKISPSLFEAFLQETGYESLMTFLRLGEASFEKDAYCQNRNALMRKNDPINDPINIESPNLTERQHWFLNELRLNRKASISDLVRRWGISQKTAKRDIHALKGLGLIAFSGAKKTGHYVLLRDSSKRRVISFG